MSSSVRHRVDGKYPGSGFAIFFRLETLRVLWGVPLGVSLV
jgi:hypothetical protein